MMNKTDALILGGGPAGLATAIALRQRGLTCVVVEPLAPGIDKGCGEGLMPDALEALDALGLRFNRAEGHPCSGISFLGADHSARARFPGQAGLGLRRTHLHQRLARLAEEAGATLRLGSRATLPSEGLKHGAHHSPHHGADREFVLVDGQPVQYRWLIGADGEASSVRRWAGLDRATHLSRRFALRRHYQTEPWSNSVEVYWGAGAQVYVTPIASNCVCVVLIAREPARVSEREKDQNPAAWLDAFPTLAARLRSAPSLGRRGAVTVSRRLLRVATGRVLLVGDASGSVDAITGEGLAMAFQQAIALAASLAMGGPEAYIRSHRLISRPRRRMAALMLLMDRYPELEHRAIHAFAERPALFEELLAVHVGRTSLRRFVLRHGAFFAWKLLAQAPTRSGRAGTERFLTAP